MPYPRFDRSKLKLAPLSARVHDMDIGEVLPLDADVPDFPDPQLRAVADRIVAARRNGKPVVMLMGAHIIKQGLSHFLIDLLERGIVNHLGGNGACAIHDFELALIGATTESVARYLREGQFGLWQETSRINDAVRAGAAEGLGYGEAVGRMIEEEEFPHRDVSILATGYRLRVPITIHIGIGQDIHHEHPNCDAAALGQASYWDFLTFAHTLSELEGGVFLNYGTAVMGPEVFQKALAMARNVAHQEGRHIERFTTAVFDLLDIGAEWEEEPPKTDPRYYFRPYKTILVRAVKGRGESFYIRGDHKLTLPNLQRMVVSLLNQNERATP